MAFEKGLNYNAPNDTPSTIDEGGNSEQMNTFFYLKRAIIDAKKEQYFLPLASVIGMPKHYGKTIKVYQYVPLLDDRNVNDQGIDAENGGRVNRVGFTRLQREGSIQKLGFFYEFTQESLDFDSDSELKSHLSRELLNGASEIVEDMLQKDLLAAAGVVVYPQDATDDDEMSAEGGAAEVVDYRTLMRADQILTDNRCPRQTTIIKGSRLTDTKTLPSCRIAYCGSEVNYLLKSMKDLFGNKAFIEVQHYADAGNVLNGEIGSIDNIRFVQVPEMLHWAGVGATVTTNPGFHATDGKYDVFPILIVGDDSFNTIGFQTNGKTVNFSITTKMPGPAVADRNDPYGETGFSSIKWYYGFLCRRPERIAVIKTLCPI